MFIMKSFKKFLVERNLVEANLLIEQTSNKIDLFVQKIQRNNLDEALFYEIIEEMYQLDEFLGGRIMGALGGLGRMAGGLGGVAKGVSQAGYGAVKAGLGAARDYAAEKARQTGSAIGSGLQKVGSAIDTGISATAKPFIQAGQKVGQAAQAGGRAVGTMYKQGQELHRIDQMQSSLDGIRKNIIPKSDLDNPQIHGMLNNLQSSIDTYQQKIASGAA